MPSATTTKPAVKGMKRKEAPGKDVHVKKSKKVKTDEVKKPVVKEIKNVKKVKKEKAKKVEKVESEDDDSDGGVPLDKENLDWDSENEENLPKAEDGLHPDRAKAVVVNSQSSKEAHAKQKLLAQERKASKPLADELARTKKIWERLRRKSHVPIEERKKLVGELFEIITGRVKDYVLKHDSVRIVQTAIKYANLEQKRMIAKELAGTYRQLAESRYAKFLIGKLLVQGDDEIRDIIVPEFFGHVRRLIKHPEASWILDDVYRGVATKQQKAIILREWYGAEFSLFQKGSSEKVTSELSEILATDPGKRAPIMRYLQELINHLIQKKLTGFTLLHDAMLQYFLNAKAGTEEITDFIELLKGDEEGDLLKNLAFTKSGSRVVCLALAYGTSKDRRHILKAYKDTLQMMAADPNGHIVILTAYEVIDDTVSTAKAIFPELLSKDPEKQVELAVAGANDLNARTTLLYLFQGRSKALFPTSLSSDLEVLAEIDEIRTATSKKAPETRRAELAKALSPFLLNAISKAAPDLVANTFGSQLITEVLFGAEGDKTEALAAVAATAAGNPGSNENIAEINIKPYGERPEKTDIVARRLIAGHLGIKLPQKTDEESVAIDEAMHGSRSISSENANSLALAKDAAPEEEAIEGPSHIAATSHGGKMLKTLIAGGRFDKKSKSVSSVSPPLDFADILYPQIKDFIVHWSIGSSSFVVLALLESNNFNKKDEVLSVLRKNKRVLEKAATEETAEQKARRELEEAEPEKVEKNAKKGKKSKKVPVRAMGNQGAAMLLGML